MSQPNDNWPPRAIEAERAALSCALINAEHAMPILLTLDDSDFYSSRNRTLFQVMRDTWEAGDPLDFITLTEILRNRNHDELENYLAHTLTYSPSALLVQQHVDKVADRARRRRIIDGQTQLMRLVSDMEVPIEQVVEEGTGLLEGQIPPDRGGSTAEDGVASVLAKAHFYYSNPIGEYETRGIDTGYDGLNKHLDGWKRGYVYYVLGLEHSGKTTMALNFAMNVLKRGGHAVVFSLEQSTDATDDPERSSLWERLVLSQAGLETRKYQRGDLSDAEYEMLLDAGNRVSRWNLTMYDSLRTIPEMEAAARRVAQESRVDLMVIDYLKLIEQHESFRTRNEEIGGLTSKLKRLALRLAVPIVVPHQVSSKQIGQRHEKRIQLSDAYESGHLSQDADVVMGLNRPELFDLETEKPSIIELDILKDRIGAGTGWSVDLYFNKHTGVITSVYLEETFA
jgi:replicative DNA helicase